jgi:hypothetical protein
MIYLYISLIKMYESGHAFYEKLQNSGNILLVKDDVGRPKVCVRQLPESEFVYGKKAASDSEGAGSVMSYWKQHTVSKAKRPDRDFKKMNIIAVGKRCITPKQVKDFRKENDIRIKEARGRADLTVSLPDSQFFYGVPTKPPTPFHRVISHEYGKEASEVQHQVYSSQPSDPKFIVPSYQQRDVSKNYEDSEARSSMFKMRKFQKVGPKVDSYSKSPIASFKKTESEIEARPNS